MPKVAERADQRIIAETVPTIHAARARSDLDNVHANSELSRSHSCSCRSKYANRMPKARQLRLKNQFLTILFQPLPHFGVRVAETNLSHGIPLDFDREFKGLLDVGHGALDRSRIVAINISLLTRLLLPSVCAPSATPLLQ